MEELILSIALIFSGILTIFFGNNLLLKNKNIINKGIKARAKIVDFVKETSNNIDDVKQDLFYPIIEFKNKELNMVRQTLNFGTNPKIKDQFIDIWYLKKESEYQILLDTSLNRTFIPFFIIIIGFVFSSIGLFLILKDIIPQLQI